MNSCVQQVSGNDVVLTGKEFGEFDLNTDGGIKALREVVAKHLNGLRGQAVFCKALNADVEIRKKGIKKYLSTSSNPVKLQIAGSLLDIIKNGKVFKPSTDSYDSAEKKNKIKYHYLVTGFVIAGMEYKARLVIKQDAQGKFHYDLQVKDLSEMLDGLEFGQENTPNRVARASTDSFGGVSIINENFEGSQDELLDGIDPIKNPSVPNFQKALAVSDFDNIVYEDDTPSQGNFDDETAFDSTSRCK